MTDVVFHIDEQDRWEQLLSNVEHFARDFAQGSKIVIVINGPAVRTFNGFDVHPEYGKVMRALVERGVKFAMCANSLRNRQIPKDILPDFIEVVPQGVAYIVEKQGAGYAYIKP